MSGKRRRNNNRNGSYRKRKGRRRRAIRLTAGSQLAVIFLLLIGIGGLIALSRCSVPLASPARAPREAVYTPDSSRPAPFFTAGLEIPSVKDAQFLLPRPEGRYTLYYDTTYRQAAWVAYILTRDDVRTQGAKRSNRFYSDTTIRRKGWPYATDRDYARSGYDRGHLLPSADRNNTQTENDATFCLSNISPQRPDLNRKVWNELENRVRTVAERYDTVYIVTGSELKAGLPRTGANGVGIPERYFKALLTKKGDEYISIAFLVPNEDRVSGPCWKYALSVNEVEKLLGIDFFPNLPDHWEEDIESRCELDSWK